MKKQQNTTSKTILILLSIFSLFFIACKNNENNPSSQTPSQNEDIAVKNGYLAFKDRDVFESTIASLSYDTLSFNPTARKASQSINLPGFTSMLDVYLSNPAANTRVTSDTMPINDEVLAALVTPEGIIEIGEWIFKINKINNSVAALHESNSHFLTELKSDIANPNIYLFSTNDDILDLLEEGLTQGTSTSRVSILCGGGAGESNETTQPYTAPAPDKIKLIGSSQYKKFGVYFHLYTSVYVVVNEQNGNIIIQHTHAYYYKTNCKKYVESGPYTFNNDLKTGDYNFLSGSSSYDCRQNIYKSTRGLHDYIVTAQYSYKGGGVIVPKIEAH